MADWEKIGNALSGFGAGVQGNLPQFMLAQQAKKQKLSDERLQAAATDMYDAYNMLEAGDLDGARDLGERRYAAIMKLNGDPSDTVDYMELLSSDPSGQRAQEYLKNGLKMAAAQGFKVPADIFGQEKTEFQKNIAGLPPDQQNKAIRIKAGVEAKLSPQQEKIELYLPDGVTYADATRGQLRVALNLSNTAAAVSTVAPPELLVDLTPDARRIAAAAFKAAGGGAAGLAALNLAVGTQKEAARFQDLPNILKSRFPNASSAERQEIDAAVSSSTNVDDALGAATAIRENQRTKKKAQVFQRRGVNLLKRIIGNPNLPDVVGSLEGDEDSWLHMWDDDETSLIADIEEVSNILTVENLDLLTGILSDSDLALLKSLGAGGLNRKRSDIAFLADAKDLLGKLSSQLVVTVDDPSTNSVGAQLTEQDVLELMTQRPDLTREQIINAVIK